MWGPGGLGSGRHLGVKPCVHHRRTKTVQTYGRWATFWCKVCGRHWFGELFPEPD